MCLKEITDPPVAMQPNLVPLYDMNTVVSVDTAGTEEGDIQQSGTSPELVQSTSEQRCVKYRALGQIDNERDTTSRYI